MSNMYCIRILNMKKYVAKIKEEKNTSVNIVIFSVILSTIINIVSSSLCDLWNISPIIHIVLGVITIIILIVVSLLYKISKLNSTTKFNGMFIIDETNKNHLIKIPDYKINNNMCDYLESAFVENKAIQSNWENGNFQMIETPPYNDKQKTHAKCNDSVNLLLELIEYSILENFSTFISDYFNSLNLLSKIEEWPKESVPDIFFSNRFLKLFSEEMNNRSMFVDVHQTNAIIEHGERIIASYKNGAMYRRFDLYLPKGTKIYKNNNSITIDTKLFVVTIEYLYDGFSTVIGNDFYRYYIGKEHKFNYSEYEFNINVHVKYKWTSIFKIFDWKYYNWLDEYIFRLQHYCDKKTFIKDIGWNYNKTLIKVLKNIRE